MKNTLKVHLQKQCEMVCKNAVANCILSKAAWQGWKLQLCVISFFLN